MVLHDISAGKSENPKPVQDANADHNTCLFNTMNEILLIHKPPIPRKVLLKFSKVIIRNGKRKINAYAIQDDGLERIILLHSVAQQLGHKGQPQDRPGVTCSQRRSHLFCGLADCPANQNLSY